MTFAWYYTAKIAEILLVWPCVLENRNVELVKILSQKEKRTGQNTKQKKVFFVNGSVNVLNAVLTYFLFSFISKKKKSYENLYLGQNLIVHKLNKENKPTW